MSLQKYIGCSRTPVCDADHSQLQNPQIQVICRWPSSVVPGALPGRPLPDGSPGPSLYCAVIVKTVDAQTRAKTGINELLRE